MAGKTDEEFVMVSDPTQDEPETKIVFEDIGDAFTGVFLGMRKMDNESGSYQQARFEKDGEIYFTNANYSLRTGLSKVRSGTKIRITFASELDTGQASPMRVFTVEVSRRTVVSRTTPAAVSTKTPST